MNLNKIPANGKLHELCAPTPYQLWLKYVSKDELLRNCVDIDYFAEELAELGAIELFRSNKVSTQVRCRILNSSKIPDHVQSYYSRSVFSQSWRKMIRNIKELL